MRKILSIIIILSFLSFSKEEIPTSTEDAILSSDFSQLWISFDPIELNNKRTGSHSTPLGYIGNDFQRFYIHFTSIIKNDLQPSKYYTYGKTKVKNNICTFQGNISIHSITWIETIEELANLNIKQGLISGTYSFFEDPQEKGTGGFSGTFRSMFYLDEKGILHYDDLMIDADGYSNNQFIGTWTSYKTNTTKTCNWGDYRIPESKNLDIGAGEFIPDSQYYPFGWKNYEYIFENTPKGEKAREEEHAQWWK